MAAKLPVRHMVIPEKQLKELQKDVWSNRFVTGALQSSSGKRAGVKIRYRGGHTRSYSKRSYEIVKNGKTFHYNAEVDDPSLIRNALSFRFFEWIGVPCSRAKHCLMYLNGEKLGVYLELEGVDRMFFRKRGIGVDSLFYAVNDGANFSLNAPDSSRRKSSLFSGYQQMLGTSSDRRKLTDFILRLNSQGSGGTRQLYLYLLKRLDIENYLRWLAGAVLTGNYDGFDQNYAFYRHRRTQKYRIIPWDYEGTWGRNCYGRDCGSDLVRVSGYNTLTRRLLQFTPVRRRYKQLLRQMLAEVFTVRRIMPAAEEMHTLITPHVYEDSARKWSRHEFDGELDFIRNYIEERRQIVSDALREL